MSMPLEKQTTEGTPSFWSRHWQKIFAALIWLALVGSFVGYSFWSGKGPTEILRDVVTLLESPAGPLLYIFLYSIRGLAFFSAVVLTLLGGAIWGPIFGVIYTVIGANLSATVAYTFGYFLGQGVISESDDEGVVSQYANRLRRNAFQTVLIMRLIYLPYDLVNYLGGFLRISYKEFILGTILGSLPGTITFVLAGASIDLTDVFEGNFDVSVLNPWAMGASVVLFVGSLYFSRWLKRREARREGMAVEEQPAS